MKNKISLWLYKIFKQKQNIKGTRMREKKTDINIKKK